MSKIHVHFGGDYYALECWAGTRTDMAAVVKICQIRPGDSWDDLTAKVREHETKHECGMADPSALGVIAELLPNPCREPGIADGNDRCPCGSGEVWPCSLTRAAWLAAGLDPREEIRKVLDRVKRDQETEQAEYEAWRDGDDNG